MPELVVDHPREARRIIRLEREVLTVGREPGCDVVLESGFVSRLHLRLERQDEAYTATDPGSRNGAFLNGRKLQVGRPYRLQPGDEIAVADFVLTFVEAPTVESTLDWSQRLPDALYIDVASRQVWFGTRKLDVHLTLQEFDLLAYLYERRGLVVPHEEIGERIWGSEMVGGKSMPRYDLNMIHQLVSRVRRKLQPDPKAPPLISSVARVGYKLEERPRG
jgi:hypothetical protein